MRDDHSVARAAKIKQAVIRCLERNVGTCTIDYMEVLKALTAQLHNHHDDVKEAWMNKKKSMHDCGECRTHAGLAYIARNMAIRAEMALLGE